MRERRSCWGLGEEVRIGAETHGPGVCGREVRARHGVHSSLLHDRRRQTREDWLAATPLATFVPGRMAAAIQMASGPVRSVNARTGAAAIVVKSHAVALSPIGRYGSARRMAIRPYCYTPHQRACSGLGPPARASTPGAITCPLCSTSWSRRSLISCAPGNTLAQWTVLLDACRAARYRAIRNRKSLCASMGLRVALKREVTARSSANWATMAASALPVSPMASSACLKSSNSELHAVDPIRWMSWLQ